MLTEVQALVVYDLGVKGCKVSSFRVTFHFFSSYQMCKILVENVYNVCIYVYICKFVCIYLSFLFE